MATLRQLIEGGRARAAVELNLSWNSAITRIPPMPRKALPRLESLKLAGCDSLRTVPAVPARVLVTKPVHLAEGDYHPAHEGVDW